MKTKIKYQLLGLLICILIIPNLSGQDISNAYKAFRQADYYKAKGLYESVINNDQSSSEDKINSYQKLVYLAWNIKSNIEESRRLTELAFNVDFISTDIMISQAKYELEANKFEEAKNIYSSIEGSGWQGIGVETDIVVDEDAALHIAHKEFIKSKFNLLANNNRSTFNFHYKTNSIKY